MVRLQTTIFQRIFVYWKVIGNEEQHSSRTETNFPRKLRYYRGTVKWTAFNFFFFTKNYLSIESMCKLSTCYM